MKKIILRFALCFLAIVGLSFSYLFIYEPKYNGQLQTQAEPMVFAHRGFGNLAPDNSLKGAQLALENGLDGVDVDAQFSADKQTVIFHDVTLERFTTGEGRVDSKTVAQLQTYDLGDMYGKGFNDVYIATFEDFVSEVTPKAKLMVELKVPGVADTGIEKQVVDIIAKYDAFEEVYISSFNPVVLYRLKQIDPKVQTVFIFMDTGWDPKRVAETKAEDRVALPWYLQTEITRKAIRKIIKPDALSINHQVDERVIDTLLEKGNPVFLWALNTQETVAWGLSKRPYGIISDEPLLAKEGRDDAVR
jgi:glycerophosphoryl diester phosphodiesterase